MALSIEQLMQKHYFHPETIALLQSLATEGVKPYFEIGVEESRKVSLARSLKYSEKIDFDGSDREIIVPSSYDKDGIPVSVYTPTPCSSQTSPVILVYFHGGGNTIGNRKTHESICKIIARDASCIVLNVEYRLAPEHKFPANNDDAKCVVEWVAANKKSVGGSPSSKLGVSGDSAGGRLAAVVCHEARDLIDFAVLIYPNTSSKFNHPSVQEFASGPGITLRNIDWFMEQYLNTMEERDHPRASVLLSKDFSCLPHTLLVVAELDALRDACYEYYEKLKAAGNRVELKTIKGAPHAFWSLTAAFKETGKEAQTEVVKFIQQLK